MTFAAPVTAIALKFGSIYTWGDTSELMETFTFAGNAQSYTLPGTLSGSSLLPSFVGFTSGTAFTLVSINDPALGLAIRDVTF